MGELDLRGDGSTFEAEMGMQAHASKPGTENPRWPLWSVLWRVLFLGPILWPLGVLVLVVALASIVTPPVYVCLLGIEGHYYFASGLLLGWLLWLRFGFRLLGWLLQGIEYSSL
jgi:hypothetical protein